MSENKENIKVSTGKSIAALTLGIIAVISNMFWYVCLPTGILAIIFGAKSIKETEGRKGKAGLVLGIVGLAVMVLVYVGITILYLYNY